MPRILRSDTIQANAGLLGVDYSTAYDMHVEDAAGIPIPRIAELDIDTGECVVLLCYDNTNSGIGTVRVDVKLNYFKLVSGTWYLEYKAKDIAQ